LPFFEKGETERDENSLEARIWKRLKRLFEDGATVSRQEWDHLAAFSTEPADQHDTLIDKLSKLRESHPEWEILKQEFDRAKGRIADLANLRLSALAMLEARIIFLQKLKRQKDLTAVKPGPGRVDAFGSARLFLFSDADARPLNAPVRYPAIWTLGNRHWVHWDGNTNSISERNAGQALGVGALVDTSTLRSTLLPVNLYRLEDYVRRLPAPPWPDVFGKVDPASPTLAHGKKLYEQNCASCHEGTEKRETADLPDGKGKKILANGKVLVYRIGTDDARQSSFAAPLSNGKEFAGELGSLQRSIKDQAVSDFAAELSQKGMKDVKDRMDALDKNPEWLKNEGYIARPLAGAWATAPFLHNGSVPSMADLLKPAKDRPVTFFAGCREYDPDKLGFVYLKEMVPSEQRTSIFEFDTRLPGNSNAGHEFGTSLSTDDKKALLLYLKR